MARLTDFTRRAVLAFAAGVSAQGSTGVRTFEAENAVLSGTTIDTTLAGFTGTK
jgi:mannan endo-1,4-beta-mannosidase